MNRILIIVVLTLISIILWGQESEKPVGVKISTDKVKIEGKYYFIHIVRKGETLYSISRAYNVSQIEIAMENPDIYLGLQVDQALKIPIKENQQGILGDNQDENYIYHIVRKKETLFGLSRKYEISMEDIIKANPEVEEGLKVSQVVLIPKKSMQTLGDAEPQKSERFIYHEVKPKEGFFAISQKYGVSQEVIKRFNADLVKDGIKLGTILRIPRDPNDTLLTETYIPATTASQSLSHPTPSEAITFICDTFEYNRTKNIFNIALLLPFFQDDTKEIESDIQDYGVVASNTNPSTASKSIISQSSSIFLDFYQGALLAIDSLKKEGLSINLSIYNTGKKAEIAKNLLNEKGVRNANLIIGPVYPECQKPISEYATENRIPMVSPLAQNNYLLGVNPYFFQANPSFTTQLEEFIQKIDLCTGQNIVLLHENDSTNVSLIESFKELVRQRISNCSNPDKIHFKEVTYSPGSAAPDVQERISHSLVLDRENIILVPSNNEVFVTDMLGNLHTLSTIHKYSISLYGFPRWQRFGNVQVEYYYQLQLHLFSPFFVDYNNGKVKNFIENYREFFRSEPTQYSFRGYDVMFFFLSALKEYGADFQYCISNHKVDLLQSDYKFNRTSTGGGYENRSVHMLRYTKKFDIVKEDTTALSNDSRIKPLQYHFEEGQKKPEAVIEKQ
jgi:LysM repeat protein/ABC-type branched-subunit amino acid transport system substrate-binding protein